MTKPKQVQPPPEEQLAESIRSMEATVNVALRDMKSEMKLELQEIRRSVMQSLLLIDKKMNHLESYLDKFTVTNQNIEETLLNVLLAIRQNEYLQAWYPAQHGFLAQKIVGKHPAKEIASKK